MFGEACAEPVAIHHSAGTLRTAAECNKAQIDGSNPHVAAGYATRTLGLIDLRAREGGSWQGAAEHVSEPSCDASAREGGRWQGGTEHVSERT